MQCRSTRATSSAAAEADLVDQQLPFTSGCPPPPPTHHQMLQPERGRSVIHEEYIEYVTPQKLI